MALVRRHPACPTDRDLSHRWVHRFSARAATSVSERTLAARALNLWTTGTTERTEQTRGVNFERRWGVKIGRRLTGQEVFDHRSAKAVPPKPLEQQGRADTLGLDRCRLALLDGGEQHRALGEAGAGPQQPIELAALLERIEPARGRHHGLARLAVDPMAFHHLEIFEPTRSLGAEIHAGLGLPARESHVLQRCQAFTAILLALRNRPIPSFATAECGFQPRFDAPTV